MQIVKKKLGERVVLNVGIS